MDTYLKVGIVGAPRGCSFIPSLRAQGRIEVAALCDANPEALNRYGDRFGIEKRFTEYEAMLEEDIDMVVVATPMNWHAPQAIAALQRDKHVLSEVTAAVDLRQCCDLVDAVRASRAKYMMAENYCYIRSNVLVREMARQRLFGDIYFGEGEYIHELKGLLEITPWRKIWQTGRNACTYPTHSLGPVLEWFSERVATVSCLGSGRHYGEKYIQEDSILMFCKLTGGALVKIRFDILSNRPHNLTYCSLQGTRGCYEALRGFGDDHKIWLADFCKDMNEWKPLSEFEQYLPDLWRNPPEEALKAGHWGGDYFEVRDFVEAIIEDREPPIDIYRALDFTVPGLVSEDSIAQGGIPLPVPDFRNYVTGSKTVPKA